MSLTSAPSAIGAEGAAVPMNRSRTLGDAVRFLESLKPRVDDILRVSATGSADHARKTRVTLNSMDTMKLENDGTAHVAWVGPKDGNAKNIRNGETKKLRQVCGAFVESLQ